MNDEFYPKRSAFKLSTSFDADVPAHFFLNLEESHSWCVSRFMFLQHQVILCIYKMAIDFLIIFNIVAAFFFT